MMVSFQKKLTKIVCSVTPGNQSLFIDQKLDLFLYVSRLVFKTKSSTYRRAIEPLQPHERHTHLFANNFESLSLTEQPSNIDSAKT